jgi:4-hydroxy-tetrahydrodipicolinate reductase
VGEHTARFLAEAEEITIGHRACDRVIFARGALESALWLKRQSAGLYTMQDVIA